MVFNVSLLQTSQVYGLCHDIEVGTVKSFPKEEKPILLPNGLSGQNRKITLLVIIIGLDAPLPFHVYFPDR